MIYLGSDHAGFKMKEVVKKRLAEQGLEVEDMGAHSLDPDDDYPDFIAPVARAVAQDPENSKGIVFGGSGQGEAIAANKVRGVYAAHYYGGPKEIVELARRHNNANVLSLGARFMDEQVAKEVVDLFLQTPFDGGRHERRVAKISKLEQE